MVIPMDQFEPRNDPHLSTLPREWLVAEALARLSGQETLYLKMLRGFLERYGLGDVRLLAHLERGELCEAHRLVHSIKSLSLGMGAAALHKEAAVLEGLLERGTRRPEGFRVGRFCKELRKTVAVLSHFLSPS